MNGSIASIRRALLARAAERPVRVIPNPIRRRLKGAARIERNSYSLRCDTLTTRRWPSMEPALADLTFSQQLSKQGLLQQTTKCCATGTCNRDVSWSAALPIATLDFDSTDPSDLLAEVGELRFD
jgi:hypothetical protein